MYLIDKTPFVFRGALTQGEVSHMMGGPPLDTCWGRGRGGMMMVTVVVVVLVIAGGSSCWLH